MSTELRRVQVLLAIQVFLNKSRASAPSPALPVPLRSGPSLHGWHCFSVIVWIITDMVTASLSYRHFSVKGSCCLLLVRMSSALSDSKLRFKLASTEMTPEQSGCRNKGASQDHLGAGIPEQAGCRDRGASQDHLGAGIPELGSKTPFSMMLLP